MSPNERGKIADAVARTLVRDAVMWIRIIAVMGFGSGVAVGMALAIALWGAK